LSGYIDQLNEVAPRRAEAEVLLAELEGVSVPPLVSENSQIPFEYIGYEIDALLPALREIEFPVALYNPPPVHRGNSWPY